MNKGDIVYFRSQYQAHYGKEGGSYYYYFKPGVRYQIESYNSMTACIINLEDDTSHFITSNCFKLIISQAEYREIQIKEILK